MDSTAVFYGVIPLIAFAIIDSYAGLKTALIAAVALALLEMGYSIYALGELDWITGVSVGLILVFATSSYKFKNSLYIKLQPFLLGLIFGIVFLVTYFQGNPILREAFFKYAQALPESIQQNKNNPIFLAQLNTGTLVLGYGHILHAGCALYAAFKMSNLGWILVRVLGYYLMLFICLAITSIMVFKSL